eukprot:COSAG04_NODE_20153_length_399_cov_1.276667_1_plen_122_part_01
MTIIETPRELPSAEPAPGPADDAGSDDEIYYSDGLHDAEVAPSLAAFEALVASGVVTGETIVWKEGWDDWVVLDKCREKLAIPSPAKLADKPRTFSKKLSNLEVSVIVGSRSAPYTDGNDLT